MFNTENQPTANMTAADHHLVASIYASMAMGCRKGELAERARFTELAVSACERADQLFVGAS